MIELKKDQLIIDLNENLNLKERKGLLIDQEGCEKSFPSINDIFIYIIKGFLIVSCVHYIDNIHKKCYLTKTIERETIKWLILY